MAIYHRLIKHVQKHRRKYIFGLGTACGLCIFKIIIIAYMFLGITAITGRSNAAEEKVEMYETLQIFNQMDDIAHKKVKKYIKEGHCDETDMANFNTIDNSFHNTNNLNERYSTAKKIISFLTVHEKMRSQMQDVDEIQKDKEFGQVLQQFSQMQ